MSLDDIYMPPIRIDGTRLQRLQPLGPWPEKRTPTEQDAARRAKAKRYRDKNREKRLAYDRAWRAKRKAA
jgi:hypothetical protein